MATRAALFTQNDDGSWLQTYVHYDGYPTHMQPALAKADPEAIRAQGFIRQIREDGTLDIFHDGRAPSWSRDPEMPSWADHAYVLTATGWRHVRYQTELDAVTAA